MNGYWSKRPQFLTEIFEIYTSWKCCSPWSASTGRCFLCFNLKSNWSALSALTDPNTNTCLFSVFVYPLVLFFSTTAKLFNLPLEVILKNNISLSYFIDFMNAIGTINFITFLFFTTFLSSSLLIFSKFFFSIFVCFFVLFLSSFYWPFLLFSFFA